MTDTTAPGIRARNRAAIEAAILAAARRQLAEQGAAALSVRAVAREVGMAPSAIFRYVADRDELLTVLIVDSYTDLADSIAGRIEPLRPSDLTGRWRALTTGLRDWALAHPHEYALILGSPVPQYHAPADRTNPAGERLTGFLLEIGRIALAQGRQVPAPFAPGVARRLAGRAVRGVLAVPEVAEAGLPALWVTNGITAWNLIVGTVSCEVFEQLGPGLGDPDALFEYAMRVGRLLVLGE